jgi:hypothetical protein
MRLLFDGFVTLLGVLCIAAFSIISFVITVIIYIVSSAVFIAQSYRKNRRGNLEVFDIPYKIVNEDITPDLDDIDQFRHKGKYRCRVVHYEAMQ